MTSDPGEDAEGLFDPIRKRRVAATPEERVRQAVIRYLVDTVGVPANLIGVEFSLANLEPGNFHRVDVVAWRPGEGQLAPWLLVECKEPGCRIDDDVAWQAAGYLKRIPCRYVMLTNGKVTRVLEREGEGYVITAGLPYFPPSHP
ncbi:MAG: type I restriction enzyme HsdR N-terminal domain-containing protein [Fibrobacteres bacterium]|nr:type I restriction enzyme HsdR N-terminal domain-containing protein [Fibrobacterota bacterium]